MLKDLRPVAGRDIKDWFLEQSSKLDTLVFEEEEFQGIIDICKEWSEVNPDIYTFLIDYTEEDNPQVIGYINAMPVKEKLYRDILEGNVVDTLIKAEDILPYEDNTSYYMYFCSIVVHPDYQGTRAFTTIFDTFMSHLLELSKRGIYIKAIVAEGATAKGARLCRLSGLKKYKETDRGTEIYYSENVSNDFRPTSCSSKEVKDIYESH